MADWVISVIQQYGYFAVWALMLLENLFPPLPSELIMPFAGFLAARGELHPAGVVAAGALGSLAGACPWYCLGRRVGAERLQALAERHGRWFAVRPEEIERARQRFDRHGPLVLVVGRMIPALRTLVALPAGMVPVPLATFICWTLVGSSAWTAVLTLAGYLLESHYERLSDWLNPVATGVFVLVVAWYVLRVVRYPRRRVE